MLLKMGIQINLNQKKTPNLIDSEFYIFILLPRDHP